MAEEKVVMGHMREEQKYKNRDENVGFKVHRENGS